MIEPSGFYKCIQNTLDPSAASRYHAQMRNKKSILVAIILLVVSGSLSAGSVVRIATRFVRVSPLPGGPAALNRISVNVYKPSSVPKARLILVSGWTCGAAWLHFPAKYLAEKHNIEVWTVNRRATLFEDRKKFRETVSEAYSGNRGRIRNALIALNRPQNFARFPLQHLKKLGIRQNMLDLHEVVKAAGKDGKKLYLGGWSDGVELVMCYSLSEFDQGKRGHNFLKGLLCIDENPEWGRVSQASMATKASQWKGKLRRGRYYETRYPGITLFEAAGMFPAKPTPFAGCFYGRPWRGRPYTGRALLGWLYDGGGRRSAWSWLFSCGSLVYGKSVDWKSGDATPMDRIVAMHRAPGGVWEWFYPLKIMADYWELGAWGMHNPDMGITADRGNRLPLFTAYSSMNRFAGKIPAGVEWYRRRTGIRKKQIITIKLYDLKHGDILLAPSAEKRLWKKAARWISKG